jgi:hypothetical protein
MDVGGLQLRLQLRLVGRSWLCLPSDPPWDSSGSGRSQADYGGGLES